MCCFFLYKCIKQLLTSHTFVCLGFCCLFSFFKWKGEKKRKLYECVQIQVMRPKSLNAYDTEAVLEPWVDLCTGPCMERDTVHFKVFLQTPSSSARLSLLRDEKNWLVFMKCGLLPFMYAWLCFCLSVLFLSHNVHNMQHFCDNPKICGKPGLLVWPNYTWYVFY